MMVSFVMPAYKGLFLQEAIDSIVRQSCDSWELIIVDDCSPDSLKEIVNFFSDSRIRYIRNSVNIGRNDLVKQWNQCLPYASGDYIVLAADDDLYRPSFCEEIIRLASKYPDVDVIRSSVEQIDEHGNHLKDDNILPEFTNKYEYLNWWVTGRAFTCVGNFAFKRSALLEIGGFYSFPCAFGSDVATPIRLSYNGVANTRRMLFCFRQSVHHLSADSTRLKEKMESISLLSEFLCSIHHEEPDNPRDKEFYSIVNEDYLHKKCIYEYFNLVIKYVSFKDLFPYLKLCRLATFQDKTMIFLRWIKSHLFREHENQS